MSSLRGYTRAILLVFLLTSVGVLGRGFIQVPPVLDANDGIPTPPLQRGVSNLVVIPSEQVPIKSKVVKAYHEVWIAYATKGNPRGRELTIKRWHFSNTDDPAHYIGAPNSDRVFGQAVFPGWNGALIGERSYLEEMSSSVTGWYWGTLIFTSGPDLIRVEAEGLVDRPYLFARAQVYLQRVKALEQSGQEDNDDKGDDNNDQGDHNRDTPRHP